MLKKLMMVLVSVLFMSTTFAEDAANIKLNIQGSINDNRYFLCMQGVGCLSILAAKKGKIYPMLRPVEMNSMYVMDLKNNLRLNQQGLPASCDVTVKPKQTITISGTLIAAANNSVKVSQLQCRVS